MALSLLFGLAFAQGNDLVILNGRVMDPETNFDKVRNVGVKNDKIVAITKDVITSAEAIDATGYVVAPGFIDWYDNLAGRSRRGARRLLVHERARAYIGVKMGQLRRRPR